MEEGGGGGGVVGGGEHKSNRHRIQWDFQLPLTFILLLSGFQMFTLTIIFNFFSLQSSGLTV